MIIATEYIQGCRRKRGSVSVLSAEAYTTTLLVMVDRVKGGGRAPTRPRQAVLILLYHYDGMHAKKWPLPLCVYSVITTCKAFDATFCL
jgi:hypothetical protein